MAYRQTIKDLTHLAREVMALAKDVSAILSSDNVDWDGQCQPLNSVGDTFIERWLLAERLLIVWSAYHDLLKRWHRLCSGHEDVPSRCSRADDLGESVANRLLRDPQLPHILAERSVARVVRDRLVNEPADLIDEMANAADLLRLARLLSSVSGEAGVALINSATGNNRRLLDRIKSLSDDERLELEENFRHYSHATLGFAVTTSGNFPTPIESYFRELRERLPMIPINNQERLEATKGIISHRLNPLLQRISSRILQTGYNRLIEDLLECEDDAGEMLGENPNGQQEPINVIPGGSKGKCSSLLLAFSSGSRKGVLTFSKVLAAVRSHLIDCGPPTPKSGLATKVVAFFCDAWDAAVFNDEFFDDFAKFHQRGVEFVFIIVPSARSRSMMSEIRIQFK